MTEGMMALQVTALWAGLLGILMLALAVIVVVGRNKSSVLLGEGGDKGLEVKIRVFGNFTEYVPMAIILMAIAEISGAAPALSLNILGAMLLVGRILHAIGLNAVKPGIGRILGALATWIVILSLSAYLLLGALG